MRNASSRKPLLQKGLLRAVQRQGHDQGQTFGLQFICGQLVINDAGQRFKGCQLNQTGSLLGVHPPFQAQLLHAQASLQQCDSGLKRLHIDRIRHGQKNGLGAVVMVCVCLVLVRMRMILHLLSHSLRR